jgi:hypothetical protein
MAATRFPIRRSLIMEPLLALLTSTAANSYVEVSDDRIVARMGLLFHESFPISEVVGVRTRKWPWVFGIGWRTDFRGHVGLIGSYGQVVEVRFRKKGGVHILPFLPWPTLPCDRLSVSVADPRGLVRALTPMTSA